MNLRKWRSSHTEVLNQIPEEIQEKEDRKLMMKDESLKTLGTHWDAELDALFVTTPQPITSKNGEITKRVVAKVVAGLYDVLGIITPFSISGKIILQKLWELNIGWDQSIPAEMLPKWKTWTDGFQTVRCHPTPRFAGAVNNNTMLHGFADSSTKAFAAAIYLRNVGEDGSVRTTLLCSKARVCPLKTRTLPELELEAAKLLAQLLSHTAAALKIPINNSMCWSDSMIALSWMQKPLHKLITFVANRVAIIQELLPGVPWRHINSEENPADLPSRGISADDMVKSTLWWKGPTILQYKSQWPNDCHYFTGDKLPGMKSTTTVLLTLHKTEENCTLWELYSSYFKLLRIVAWILRFHRCCLAKKKKIKTATINNNTTIQDDELFLSYSDIRHAKFTLLRQQQMDSFPEEWNSISKNKLLPKSSPLAGLSVSISDKQVLMVSGRVSDRKLIPLSGKHILTKLMLRTLHQFYSHASNTTLISIVGNEFYIIGIKNQLKKISRTCTKFQQVNAHPMSQRMGLLPSIRTKLQPPLFISGVDFAGPVTLREGATRKPVLFKSYLCLFICMSTRCVHLEVCKSLSTEDFLAAFWRFSNRRGCPQEMYSDNGSNFQGAANEFYKLQQIVKKAKQQLQAHVQNMALYTTKISKFRRHLGSKNKGDEDLDEENGGTTSTQT